MELSKPKSASKYENPRAMQLGKEPVTIKAGILIQISPNTTEIAAQI